MDEGHLDTERILKEVESDVTKVYRQAAEETEKKLNDYLRRFKIKDRIKREQLRKGEITKEEYNYWRTGQIMIGKRWEEMKNTLAQDLHNANNLARSIAQGYMPEVYAVNHNYATFQVEKESLVDTSYTLYDRQTVERIIKDQPDLLPPPGPRKKAEIAAGKDIKWQRGQIQSTMMQAILQGESIPHVAKRMAKELSVKNRGAAVRYARTAATGAQNAGRVDGYKRAQGMGIELEQEWLATLDMRTRHEHRYLDGQHVPVGEPFKVDGYEIKFPGDPSAPGYLIWNCRCTLVPHLKNLDQSNAPRNSKLGNMPYEEWKGQHINDSDIDHTITNEQVFESIDKMKPIPHGDPGDVINNIPLANEEDIKEASRLFNQARKSGNVHYKEEIVNVSDLTTRQDWVTAYKLKQIAEEFEGEISGRASDYDGGIRAIEHNGHIIIIDGNHRTNIAILRRQKRILVRVIHV